MKIENGVLIEIEDSDIDSDGKCVIPYGVTVIGEAVFRDAPIKSVIIPNSVVKIEGRAFQYCDLTEITIPNSVKEIEEYAFDQCDSLKAVHITDIVSWCNIDFDTDYSNPLHCAHNLYLNGELMKELVIPDDVLIIKNSAFEGCTVEKIIIPDSVTTIEKYAFYDCMSIESITIPDSVKNIGNYAFGFCESLSNVIIEGELNCIASAAFRHCDDLETVIVPSESMKSKLIKNSVVPVKIELVVDPTITINAGKLLLDGVDIAPNPSDDARELTPSANKAPGNEEI